MGVRLCFIARSGVLTTPFPQLVTAVAGALGQIGRR